jgi:hypothetical protein
MLPSRAIHFLPLLALVLALLGSAGCVTAPVKGNASKHEPRGKIDAQGNYQIETALKKGTPPGWYKVGVMAFEPGDPKNYVVGKSLIHEDYNDPDKTGIFLEVIKTPTPGAYDIKLDAK